MSYSSEEMDDLEMPRKDLVGGLPPLTSIMGMYQFWRMRRLCLHWNISLKKRRSTLQSC